MTGLAIFRTALDAISGARNAIGTGLAVALLVGPTCYCTGLKTANRRHAAELALANAKAAETDAHAREHAAGERAADALRIQTNEKELIDAIQSVPDDAPDRVRVALGCQRLRAAGTAEVALPAVCRPQGRDRGQAGARP